jgi:hypothetical protein
MNTFVVVCLMAVHLIRAAQPLARGQYGVTFKIETDFNPLPGKA